MWNWCPFNTTNQEVRSKKDRLNLTTANPQKPPPPPDIIQRRNVDPTKKGTPLNYKWRVYWSVPMSHTQSHVSQNMHPPWAVESALFVCLCVLCVCVFCVSVLVCLFLSLFEQTSLFGLVFGGFCRVSGLPALTGLDIGVQARCPLPGFRVHQPTISNSPLGFCVFPWFRALLVARVSGFWGDDVCAEVELFPDLWVRFVFGDFFQGSCLQKLRVQATPGTRSSLV